MGYKYSEPSIPKRRVLPPGEYDFVVTEVKETYTNDRGTFILPVVLDIGGKKIYDRPSAGKTRKGDDYDTIAPFLKAIGADPAPGSEPDLSPNNLCGLRGRCKLKVEIIGQGQYAGEETNAVAYYIWGAEQKPAAKTEPAASNDFDDFDDDIPF